ncbi:MAG: phage tail protein [Planctomycetota bacterium]
MNREQIARLLPEVFQRSLGAVNPLGEMLDAMAALVTPVEERLETIETIFDPYRTPDPFVRMLASWVDLEALWGGAEGAGPVGIANLTGRLRELVAAASELAKLRGTWAGLELFLETATACDGFEIQENSPGEDGKPRPFHFVVFAPGAARPFERLVRRIIELEKPAYATFGGTTYRD